MLQTPVSIWRTIWVYYDLTHNSMYLDMGFETLNLKSCESKLGEATRISLHDDKYTRS